MNIGNALSDFFRGTIPGREIDAARQERREREFRNAQMDALRAEFGDRSGGNVADIGALETVDTSLAERRRGAQIAGLGIARQILAAPPEAQDSLAQQYAPVLAPAFGVPPERIFAGLSAIRNSPDPDAAITALQSSLSDPALNQLTGSPNMMDEEGYAAAVTRGGQVRRFPGLRPTTAVNVDTRYQHEQRQRLTPNPQAGVQQYVDPQTGEFTNRIVEGSPQEIEARRATAEAAQAEQEALAPERARAAVTGNISRAIGAYLRLDQLGATIRPDRPLTERIGAWARSSPVGRAVEGAFGTEAGTQFDILETIRPNLVSAMVQATGMSARALDSNRELDFYLTAMSDPNRSLFANIGALVAFDQTFGSGDVLSQMELPSDVRERVSAEARRFRAEAPRDPIVVDPETGQQFNLNDIRTNRRREGSDRPTPQGRSREDSLDEIRARLRSNR